MSPHTYLKLTKQYIFILFQIQLMKQTDILQPDHLLGRNHQVSPA